ncbi:MAG: hypothetical protein IKC51_08250 [Myxococcaceae bacterium]|nr:hypothetical protein [Myxococcaceae bacterium]
MRRAFLSVLSISLTLATACGTPPRIDPVPQVRNGDAALQTQYEAALERWTRRAELYDRLDARLFIAGTLLSPTFRDALSARDSSLGIPPSPLLSPKPGETFPPTLLLGAYAHDAQFAALDNADGIWRLTLTTPQGTLAPQKIRRLSRPDQWLKASFPYLDRFWRVYLVTFPVSAQSENAFAWDEAVFTLQGVAGRITLDFQTVDADAASGSASAP